MSLRVPYPVRALHLLLVLALLVPALGRPGATTDADSHAMHAAAEMPCADGDDCCDADATCPTTVCVGASSPAALAGVSLPDAHRPGFERTTFTALPPPDPFPDLTLRPPALRA